MSFPVMEVKGDVEIMPVGVLRLMPQPCDIPASYENKKAWVRYVDDWFFKGVNSASLVARSGIDKSKALRHLTAIIRSFEPSHGHKIDSVAYLLSLWFEAPSP